MPAALSYCTKPDLLYNVERDDASDSGENLLCDFCICVVIKSDCNTAYDGRCGKCMDRGVVVLDITCMGKFFGTACALDFTILYMSVQMDADDPGKYDSYRGDNAGADGHVVWNDCGFICAFTYRDKK